MRCFVNKKYHESGISNIRLTLSVAIFLHKKDLNKFKIATNQSLNLGPVVFTLGPFYLQFLQTPSTTTSTFPTEYPFGRFISGITVSSRQ